MIVMKFFHYVWINLRGICVCVCALVSTVSYISIFISNQFIYLCKICINLGEKLYVICYK